MKRFRVPRKGGVQTMKRRFDVGSYWVFGGQIVQIAGIVGMSHAEIREAATGRIFPVPLADLSALPAPVGGPSALTVPQEEWDRSLALVRAFAPFQHVYALPRPMAMAMAREWGITRRHVQRLRALFQAMPVTTALCRQPRGCPKGLRRLNDAVENVINEVVATRYACRESVSKASVVERVQLRCKREQLAVPCRKAILARITAAEGPELDAQRLGLKAARQRWEARRVA
jgi:putative transposase